ncbi:PREDICTED: uncharacterized protein LOC102020325 [Chinchilla lanigera]|uniref:uncharacterized protein LOC102020325 n=1 Tax=Chinchilla lanigera TaxID=34839 RepID=UPI00038EF7D3|nr:PREDICTED: uncharacterized protein LOC102020325 [Chinchilla lanigera]
MAQTVLRAEKRTAWQGRGHNQCDHHRAGGSGRRPDSSLSSGPRPGLGQSRRQNTVLWTERSFTNASNSQGTNRRYFFLPHILRPENKCEAATGSRKHSKEFGVPREKNPPRFYRLSFPVLNPECACARTHARATGATSNGNWLELSGLLVPSDCAPARPFLPLSGCARDGRCQSSRAGERAALALPCFARAAARPRSPWGIERWRGSSEPVFPGYETVLALEELITISKQFSSVNNLSRKYLRLCGNKEKGSC